MSGIYYKYLPSQSGGRGNGFSIDYSKSIVYQWHSGIYSEQFIAPADGMFACALLSHIYNVVNVYVNGNIVAISGTGDGGHIWHKCIERVYVSKGDILSFSGAIGPMNAYCYTQPAITFYYTK